MIHEPFAVGESLLHRADPAAKIVSALVLALSIATSSLVQVAGAALIVSIVLIAMARLPPVPLAKRLATVNLFILLLWITLPLTGGGEQTITIGPVTLSDRGIALAWLITLKANAIYLLLTALMTTSTVGAIGHALQRMRLPHKLILLLLTTYRYLARIDLEYWRLRRSASLRCFHGATNLHTYRTYGYLIGMTLIRSYERSRRVHQAMLMRGFNGRYPLLLQQSIGAGDLFLLLASILLALSFSLWTFA